MKKTNRFSTGDFPYDLYACGMQYRQQTNVEQFFEKQQLNRIIKSG